MKKLLLLIGILILTLGCSSETAEQPDIQATIEATVEQQLAEGEKEIPTSRRVLKYQLQDYNKSIEYYVSNTGLKSQDPGVIYYYRGKTYYELENYALAIADFTESILLNIDSNLYLARIYNMRGNSYYRLKQYYEALLDFTKASELNPESDVYRTNIKSAADKMN